MLMRILAAKPHVWLSLDGIACQNWFLQDLPVRGLHMHTYYMQTLPYLHVVRLPLTVFARFACSYGCSTSKSAISLMPFLCCSYSEVQLCYT